jgi:hypothetical protein
MAATRDELAAVTAHPPSRTMPSMVGPRRASGESASPERGAAAGREASRRRGVVPVGRWAVVFLWLCAGCDDGGGGDVIVASAPPEPRSVEVVYEAQSVTVALGTLGGCDSTVPIRQVWTASGIAADPTGLAFEFEGSDGYRPTYWGCPALSWDELESWRIDPCFRDVQGGGSEERCYAVRDTETIRALAELPDAGAGGGTPDGG